MEPIEDLVKKWLSWDRDKSTSSEIRQLARDENTSELERRLRTRIAFGTAGLRGRMEAGFSRMNALTVVQASQGLAAYILEQHGQSEAQKSVVIGHDARWNSKKFAQLAAKTFLLKGIQVYSFEAFVHTPLVPYTVNLKNASAGIVITASHNPKDDNGYKVYWSNGSQIIPPIDAQISSSIEQNLEPWFDFGHDDIEDDQNLHIVSLQDQQTYFDRIAELIRPLVENTESLPLHVYTPMHGVGLPALQGARDAICRQAGSESIYPPICSVPEQALADPEFPTVKFPNPEEAGALDLAMRHADRMSIKLVVANDPDADRFAVAEKLPNGTWYQFTGDEVGALIASVFLQEYQEGSEGVTGRTTLLNTAVSSRLLKAMTEAKGENYEETLTGFKWLGNRAQVLKSYGQRVPFAYEEAIGYMFTDVVYDKDGVAALCFFLAAAAHWKATKDLSPYERMQQLYDDFSFHCNANTYLISPDAETTARVFNDLRTSYLGISKPHPELLGDRPMLWWRDLTCGYDSSTKDLKPTLPVDSSSQMITFSLKGGQVTMRASGTEPKIKLYIECWASKKSDASVEAQSVLSDILAFWLKPNENGLGAA